MIWDALKNPTIVGLILALDSMSWSNLINSSDQKPTKYYVRNNSSLNYVWAWTACKVLLVWRKQKNSQVFWFIGFLFFQHVGLNNTFKNMKIFHSSPINPIHNIYLDSSNKSTQNSRDNKHQSRFFVDRLLHRLTLACQVNFW